MIKILKLFSILLLLTTSVYARAPKVLVTIKPLYSLALAVMKDVGKPILLLQGATDPHHFSLVPSQVKIIKNADIIIWIGPTLENFMVKPIIANKNRRITLMSTKGLNLLHRKNSHGCILEKACVEQKKNKKSDEDLYLNEYTAIDPHIWLDIDNTIKMVQEIAYHLAALDLNNAGIYQKNAREFIKKLIVFKKEIDEKAKSLAHYHFIAFHDAYGYLEHRYKFKNSAALTVTGHEKLTLKDFSKIKAIIKKKDIRCILVDPQHPSKIEQKLAKEFDMSMYDADPLGIDIEAGPEHFFTLIRTLIQQLDDCRQKHGPKK